MSDELPAPEQDADWPTNYFNYYTEIEEHFQRARGTGLFLLSPLDWALLESWRASGVPLEAVMKGIDAAFEKWRSRKQKTRLVNSIAYCAQAVMEAAQRAPAPRSSPAGEAGAPPFSVEELRSHFLSAVTALAAHPEPALGEISHSLEAFAAEAETHLGNLEDLERRLTALEEKLVAVLRTLQTDEALYAMRSALDRELKPYRSKMNSEQLAMLERRYLDTALLERAQVPRLSLFYL